MRGEVSPQEIMFSYRTLESRISTDHPIRKIRQVVDQALKELAPTFDEVLQRWPTIDSPEQLIRATLLQILFTIRSERQLVERQDYDLMFRWFVGLSIDDDVWNHSSFSKNRDRLMLHEIDTLFFDAIKKQAYAKKLMSRDHFSVDGTLLEACASMKSLRAKDGSEDDESGDDFHGKKRSNQTHESKMKDIGLMRKLRHCGRAKVSWIFRFTAAAYNITRMKRLMA